MNKTRSQRTVILLLIGIFLSATNFSPLMSLAVAQAQTNPAIYAWTISSPTPTAYKRLTRIIILPDGKFRGKTLSARSRI